MGILSYPYDPLNPYLRNVTPFAQPQAPEGQGQGPQGFAPAPPQQPVQQQPSPMRSAWQGLLGTSNLQPGASYADRFNAIAEGPLFNAGLGLIAASAPGADGRDFVNHMQNYQQQRTQREQLRRQNAREDTADAREATTFGRQQTMWQQQDQLRAAHRRAVEMEQDPQRRAMLEAIGPEGYGQYMSQLESQRFQHNEGELDRNANIRAASIRSANENSLGRYFQSMDAQTIGDLNQQSAQLQAVGLPQLYALRETINRAGPALTGQPLDYNNRITLGRYFNGSSADRQTLEMWNAQILGPALETLRGLGAMSEREMEAAINSFSNPNMTLGAAQQLLDQRIATAERRIQTANLANQYFQQYGGLTGAGPGWPSYLAEHLNNATGTGDLAPPPNPAQQRGGQTPQRPQPQGTRPQPSQQDIRTLGENPSAERRRQFDEVYGQGAAARVLRNRVQGRGGASRPLF